MENYWVYEDLGLYFSTCANHFQMKISVQWIYMCASEHIMPWENRHGLIRRKWTRTVNSTETANQSFVLPQVKILARDDTRERDPTRRLFFCFRKTWSLAPNTSWCGIVWCLRTTVAINVFWRFLFPSSILWRVFFSLLLTSLLGVQNVTIQYNCGKWHLKC